MRRRARFKRSIGLALYLMLISVYVHIPQGYSHLVFQSCRIAGASALQSPLDRHVDQS